jgi:hypothetical protein
MDAASPIRVKPRATLPYQTRAECILPPEILDHYFPDRMPAEPAAFPRPAGPATRPGNPVAPADTNVAPAVETAIRDLASKNSMFEARLLETVAQPLGDLSSEERWGFLEQLYNYELTRGDALNASGWACDDYVGFRARYDGGRPVRECCDDFLHLVRDIRGIDALHGWQHMQNLQPEARARYRALTAALHCDQAANQAEDLLASHHDAEFDRRVSILERLRAAEDRNGLRMYEKVPSWRAVDDYKKILAAEQKGISLEQSTGLIERLLDRSPKKDVHQAVHSAFDRAVGHARPEALSTLDKLLDMLTPIEGIEAAVDTFAWLDDVSRDGRFREQTPAQISDRFLQLYAETGNLARARERLLDPKRYAPTERGDDFIIVGGVRVPVRH